MNPNAQRPVFEAYRPNVIIDNFPKKISSICQWGDQIIAGIQDGSLIFLKEPCPAPGDSVTQQWQVLKAHRGADRKPVTHVEVVHSMEGSSMLLTLTEDALSLLTLPQLELKCQALGSRGTQCFTWSAKTQLLATAVKRKIIIYTLHGVNLVHKVEYHTPCVDPVLCMTWAGGSLFIGTRKQYFRMAIPEAACALAHTQPGGGPPKNRNSLDSDFDPVLSSWGVPRTYTATEVLELTVTPGTAVNPCLLAIEATAEVVAAHGNCTSFYSEDGKQSRRGELEWGEPIIKLASGEHYIVALLPSGIEARCLSRVSSNHVVQTMGLMGGRVFAPTTATDGSLLVGFAGDKGIRQLVPVPVEEQAHVLTFLGEYQEALSMVNLLPEDTPPEVSRQLEDALRLRQGHQLFALGDYDEGFAQMALCSLDGVDHGSGTCSSSRNSTGDIDGNANDGEAMVEPEKHAHGPPPPLALILLRLMPSLVPRKFRCYLPKHAAGLQLPQVVEPHGQAMANAASAILPYLLSYRSRIMASTTGDKLLKGGETSGSRCNGGAEAGSQENIIPDTLTLLTIIDTALVKVMVIMPDTGTLLRFVQGTNFADLEAGEKVLTEAGMFAELVAMYKHHERHAQGLELLRQLSQEPSSLMIKPRGAAADLPGLPGVWAAVRYIVSLSSSEADLIREHCMWILPADPDAGLQAFLQMNPPLDPSVVLSILSEYDAQYSVTATKEQSVALRDGSMCGNYLEVALQLGVALPQDYHNELLLIYLEDIKHHQDEEINLQRRTSERLKPSPRSSMAPLPASSQQVDEPSSGGVSEKGNYSLFPESLLRYLRRHQQQKQQPQPGQGKQQAQAQEQAQEQAQDETQEQQKKKPHGEKAGTLSSMGAAISNLLGHHPHFSSSAPASGHNSAKVSRTPSHDNLLEVSTNSKGHSSEPGTPERAKAVVATAAAAEEMPETSAEALPRPDSDLGFGLRPPSPEISLKAQRAHRPALYQRLRDLVYNSEYIDPNYVLAKLPKGQLLEIQALMLERLGQHKEALLLYVHGLKELSLAEAYCDRVYKTLHTGTQKNESEATSAPAPLKSTSALLQLSGQPGDIYLMLLEAVLEGPEACYGYMQDNVVSPKHSTARVDEKGAVKRQGAKEESAPKATTAPAAVPHPVSLDSESWQELAWLLSRKQDRLDKLQVLQLLPDNVSLADVLPFLEGSLRHGIESRRNLAVVRQLHKSDNLQVRSDLCVEKQVRILHSAERACSICYKRIGPSVFVVYPSKTLAHYLCHKQQDPKALDEIGDDVDELLEASTDDVKSRLDDLEI